MLIVLCFMSSIMKPISMHSMYQCHFIEYVCIVTGCLFMVLLSFLHHKNTLSNCAHCIIIIQFMFYGNFITNKKVSDRNDEISSLQYMFKVCTNDNVEI